MSSDSLHSPSALLHEMIGSTAYDAVLTEYEAWWQQEGQAISAAVDRS